MKKIALFSLVCCACGMYSMSSMAGVCTEKRLTFIGSQQPSDDEYLYENRAKYDATVHGYNASDHYHSGNGTAFECDNNVCGGDFVQTMPSGHVFMGETINKEVKYRCVRGKVFNGNVVGQDYWSPLKEDMCKYAGIGTAVEMKVGQVIRGKTFAQLSENCDMQNGTLPGWANWDAIETNSDIATWKVSCVKKGTLTVLDCSVDTCNESKGYKLNKSTGRCEKGGSNVATVGKCKIGNTDYDLGAVVSQNVDCKTVDKADAELKTGKLCKSICSQDTQTGKFVQLWAITECPSDKPNGVPFSEPNRYNPAFPNGYKKCEKNGGSNQTCEQLYPNGTPERLACCRALKATKWIDGKCECVDANRQIDPTKIWKYTAGAKYGQCISKDGGNNVTPQKCSYVFTGEFMCSNGTRISANTRYDNIDLPSGVTTCSEFESLLANDVTRLEMLKAQYCVQYGSSVTLPSVPAGPSQDEITKSLSRLDEFTASANSKADVWTTAEGKFNTARLASDLTAGVVLGTVGGVVSGVVIKKKQIEKGFEVLHCTVGGQKTADWGDTFQVNFRR